MEKRVKILFADDHSVILKGIVSMLDEIPGFDFDVTTKLDCDLAYETINIIQNTDDPFDIVFSDLSFENRATEIESGYDLIKKLNQEFPNLKKGIITGHAETNRVFNCINNLKPSAYILKDNLNANELGFAINQLLAGGHYYSHLVHQKILSRSVVQISMDDVALQILNELPKQIKISNMVGLIKNDSGRVLKIRSIENKLSELRDLLDAKNNTDLVLKAKELGIVD